MAASDPHPFSADRPIRHRADDKLGTRTFAEAIAHAIKGWSGKDSLVIALYGAWGSGKSSIKNMMLEALASEDSHRPTVLEFNPWTFGNRDQLTRSYFDELGVALNKGHVATHKEKRQLLYSLRRYATYLKGGSDLFEILRKPAGTVFGIIGCILILADIVKLSTIPTIVGIVLAIGGLLAWCAKALGISANVLEVHIHNRSDALEDAKAQVQAALMSLKTPVVVVLDDLDRLTPSDTLEVLQLVKTHADFQGLVYVLLLDQEIVAAHIQVAMQVDGAAFLEKIVQVPLSVPAIDRPRLRQILFQRLDSILVDEPVLKRFDKTRWGNLFHGGLDLYFRTLRDVNRYAATLSFHVSILQSSETLEVNPVDLLGIESLRVFEPATYSLLARSKAVLIPAFQLESQREAQNRAVQQLMEAIPEESRSRVREIIKQLFPTIEKFLGGMNYSADFKDEWFRDLRVCAPEVFDRYFQLTVSDTDVSQSTLDRLIGKASDRENLRKEFEALADRQLLPVVFDRLEAYKQTIPLEHAVPFVTAIFDIGDQLSDRSQGFFDTSPAMHAIRIVHWYLKREPDEKVRFNVLRESIQSTLGLLLPVYFVSVAAQSNGKSKSSDTTLLSDESVTELKTLCLARIRTAASEGKLAAISYVSMLLYRWLEWGNSYEVQAFCKELIGTPEGFLRLIVAFTVRSTSHGHDDYVSREHWYVRLAEVEKFLSLPDLEQGLSRVDRSRLSNEEARAVQAVEHALERRRKGKPDEDGLRHVDEG